MGRPSLAQAAPKFAKYKEEGRRGDVLLISEAVLRDVVIADQMGRKLKTIRTITIRLIANLEGFISLLSHYV